jgi:hypothetical protein
MEMKRKINTILLVLTLAVTTVFASPAFAQQSLSVDIGKTATLVNGGEAVELKVKTVCAIEGVQLLEAFVYVTQNGNQSQFAPIPVSCGDIPRPQKATVRISALDFLFQEGDANASAFVLVYNPVTGEDFSTGATEIIRIR